MASIICSSGNRIEPICRNTLALVSPEVFYIQNYLHEGLLLICERVAYLVFGFPTQNFEVGRLCNLRYELPYKRIVVRIPRNGRQHSFGFFRRHRGKTNGVVLMTAGLFGRLVQ